MFVETIRYSLQGAQEAGFIEHPQIEMKKLSDEESFKIFEAIPVPIGDCWLFSIAYDKRPKLPKFIDRMII